MTSIQTLIDKAPTLSADAADYPPKGTWGRCSLQVSRQEIKNRDDLMRTLSERSNQHGPATGWLCFESEVSSFVNIPLTSKATSRAGVRYGEWCHEPGQSAELYLLGPNRWQLIWFEESAGDNALREVVTHVGQTHGNSPGDLRYARYWQYEPDWGFRQTHARFIGFKKKQVERTEGEKR